MYRPTKSIMPPSTAKSRTHLPNFSEIEQCAADFLTASKFSPAVFFRDGGDVPMLEAQRRADQTACIKFKNDMGQSSTLNELQISFRVQITCSVSKQEWRRGERGVENGGQILHLLPPPSVKNYTRDGRCL